MCNQAAVRALTRRGDEVFLHAQAHIMFYEQGAAVGAQPGAAASLRLAGRDAGPREDGRVRAHRRRRALAPTRLVCLEQTHNHCGGVVLPLEHMRAVRELLRPARPEAAPRRRAALQRRRRHGRAGGRVRRAVRHGEHLPLERPRGAGRLGARGRHGDAAAGGARPQDLRRRHAPGGHSRRRAACTRCATTWPGWQTTSAAHGGWPRA